MRRLFTAAALLCAAFVTSAFAQTSNATLGGTVSDSSGALIPGVTITATNTQTGIVSNVLSNEAGAYQFASLQTGIYKVTAELPGFQTQTRTDVTLGVSQQVRINFTMQVGTVAQSVEVSVAADTLIATTSSSVGTVLPEYKVRDLPLSTRYVLELVETTAGTNGGRNFAGGRGSSINVTRDGVPTNDGRYAAEMGVSASVYVSPDLVEEVRVIVAPADAETGRGSGQVQMATRSGTNELHGAVFYTNRNSALDSNSWINNFNGASKNYRNGNQFGGRLGGPIVRNKTFFFFLYEGQRYVTKKQFTGTVLTEEARRGNFRFFPGIQNGNITTNNPVVDRNGNPVTPAGVNTAIDGGRLQTISVFGRDPNRLAMDSTGWVQKLISRMPLPNDYTVGDGLNTAGHRWLRRVQGEDTTNGDGQDTNRDQYNVRIDHNFNSSHKASFTGTKERNWAMSEQSGISNWPGGYDATLLRKPEFYSASLVSTLSSSIVNEFRFGYRKTWQYNYGSAFRPDEVGDETRAQLPVINGQRFFPVHALFPNNIIANLDGAGTRGAQSPIYTYNDTVSWTKGKHAFKSGFEARFSSSDGFNGTGDPAFIMPGVTVSAGGVPVVGINTIPGLMGTSITTAQNLLLDLTGSIGTVSQDFNIRKPTDSFIPISRRRDFHQNEWGAFFKDDWKVRPDLTLNLGVRYDYYGVPYEKFGTMTNIVGGEAGLFGISGTSFADMWQPGRLNGSLTRVEFVGKNSPNPDKKLYQDDWNNFAPAVGFSWSLPWWGQDKTVLRAGYGINFSGSARFNSGLSLYIGSVPGAFTTQNLSTLGVGANYFNLRNLPLPLPAPTVQPLFTWGLERRDSAIVGFTDDRVVPYVQNWNLELQREVARNLTLEARYVGSKGTKLWGRINLNTVNIFENGILDAFRTTRAGGDAPLFDQMLQGLNLNAGVAGFGAVGTTVNGVRQTGSMHLRNNASTRAFLANGNVGQLADFINSSPTVTNRNGGLLLNSGLFAQNFIKVNPQFGTSTLDGNPGNSTYHSMQLQLTKRLSQGFTGSMAYTWSRTIGNDSNDGGFASFTTSNHYFDPRNRALNKAIVAFHRTHDIRSNGTFELPFGPGRPLLNGGTGFVARLVEQWQLGGIFSWTSGAPLNLLSNLSTITQANINMPVISGEFPKSSGNVTPVAVGATYFQGLQQVADPARSSVTTLQGLQNQFSNRAIADAQGNIILSNPGPGQLGTLGQRWIEGPGHIRLDANLVKRVRIDESKHFEFRIDVRNVLNTPWWADPETSINSLDFGKMLAGGTTGSNSADINNGARSFTLSARVNF